MEEGYNIIFLVIYIMMNIYMYICMYRVYTIDNPFDLPLFVYIY